MDERVLVRLERLERDNRMLKRSCLGLLTLLVLGCVVAAAPPASIPEEVVARSFRVVGKNGENSAMLAATDDGYVGLFFRDVKNRLRFMTLMNPAGDTTASFNDGAANRLEVGVITEPSGKDYSLRLLGADRAALWKPPVRNEGATPGR